MLRRSVLEFCALGWLTAVCPLRPAQAAQKTVSRMVRPFNLKEKTVKLNNGRTMPVLGLEHTPCADNPAFAPCAQRLTAAFGWLTRLRSAEMSEKSDRRCVAL